MGSGQFAQTIAVPFRFQRFIPERFRQAHRSHVDGFGRGGVTNRSMSRIGTLWALRSNGDEFPIEATISQVEAGNQKLFTVILRDITERKQAEQALAESEERFRTLANNMSQFAWTADAKGWIFW